MNLFRAHSNAPGIIDSGRSDLALRTLFAHAWDLAEDGVENVLEECANAGLNALTLASTYHSGWFLHPRSRTHRAYMSEGSASYFRLQDSLWKSVKLRPTLAELSRTTDWFAEAGRKAGRFGLNLIAWTVGCHNSRLGAAYPELTQQNVYGDRLPHALCPAQPYVREYLFALCRDLATNHPLWAIQLEAFGWMGFAHGHHHERDLIGLNPFEQELMGLCFCPACANESVKAGVDVALVKQHVRATLDTVFQEAPTRPQNHPSSMPELEARCPELNRFNEWRRLFSIALVTSIKTEALSGTKCRLLLQTGFEPELTNVVDGFSCFSFGKSATETEEICGDATKILPQEWNGLIQCCVQLGMGVPRSEQELRDIIQAVATGGCNGIAFYNRSESPPKMLAWLRSVGAACWASPTPDRLVSSFYQ